MRKLIHKVFIVFFFTFFLFISNVRLLLSADDVNSNVQQKDINFHDEESKYDLSQLDNDVDFDDSNLVSYDLKVDDPFENYNRRIFILNQRVDKAIMRPLAIRYKKLIKDPVARRGISNFFNNLQEPLNFVNSILQMKFDSAITAASRFMINSTLGIFGFGDFASSKLHIEERPMSFGNVLATYGIGNGPYFIIPLVGPSTLRNAIGFGTDLFIDPVNILLTKEHESAYMYARMAGRLIVIRADNLDATDTISDISLDEYAMVRSLYMQKVEYHKQQNAYTIYDKNRKSATN